MRGPAIVTTRGLRWECDGLRLEFGVFLSTSNVIDSETVVVDTDAPVLWTTQVKRS